MRSKVITVVLLSCFLLFGGHSAVWGYEKDREEKSTFSVLHALDKQQDALELRGLEEFIKEVDDETGSFLPDISLQGIINAFKNGEELFAPREVMKGIAGYFLYEITANLVLLGKLMVIAVVCAVLQSLQNSFAEGTVAKLAYFVCLLALITITLGSFRVAVTAGLQSVDKMVAFMKLLLPVLLVLLTAMGGITSAAILQPFLMLFLSFMAMFVQTVIFPLIYLNVVIAVANNISERFKVSRLAGLVKQLTKVGIGLVLTLFTGIISVQGVAGAVVDGVTLRTAKYMTGAFVPVAGSMFADALDAVVGGSLILKNALGVAGVLVLGMIVLFPVIKILTIAVIYRLAGAVLQPLGDTLIADTLDDLAGCLFLAFAAVAGVAIMFFLTITIIVGAASFTVMLR